MQEDKKTHGDNVGHENRAIHQKWEFFSQEIKGFGEKIEKSDQNSEARTKLVRLRGLHLNLLTCLRKSGNIPLD